MNPIDAHETYCRSFRRAERRQISQVSQAGKLEKGTRRHQQMMGSVRDQIALQQGVKSAVAGRATDEFDAGTRDGLPVRNDGPLL